MRELINHVEDLDTSFRNIQRHLRGVSWPSESLAHAANDVVVWLGMTIAAVERLKTLVGPLEEAKEEVKEMIKEEEGGEDIGEQVPEPEAGEVRPETPPQEPEAGAPKSRKRVRE